MKIKDSVKISPNGVFVNGEKQAFDFNTEDSWTKTIYTQSGISYPKFYKMDSLAKMAFLGLNLMEKANIVAPNESEEVALIFANASSSYDTDMKFIESYTKNGAPSPSLFVYTLPNILTGEISIFKKWYGENIFFIQEKFNAEFFIEQINFYLRKGAKSCLCGWVNSMNDKEECILFHVSNETGEITKNDLNTIYNQ